MNIVREAQKIIDINLFKMIDKFLTDKFKTIAVNLPTLIEEDCASFTCGYTIGYKRALLDLDNLLDDYYDNHRVN
jgi:hypothetical protein